MKNEKGQALIEFLLILPIMFIILLAMFDFGNILYHRYKIENELDYIVDLFQDDKEEELNTYLEENGLVMDVSEDSNTKTIYIKKEISILTPGLSNLIGDSYRIDATKTIYEG